jgi:hypothetical protein
LVPRRQPKKVARTASGLFDFERVPAGLSEEEWNEFEDWKKLIYLKMETDPNAFYYRFKPPGEERKWGPWSESEDRHFVEQMKPQIAAGHFTGKWGEFAKGIQGRVGYECRNHYDKLVKKGVFQDDRYDEEGKMKKAEGQTRASGRVASPRTPAPRRPRARQPAPRGRAAEAEPEEVELDPNANPFAKMVDPFTFEPMAQPMASPGGVVLNKDTWTSMLREGNIATCPYTRAEVKRRSLEPVTWDNIEEWMPKLKNWVVGPEGEISAPDEAPPEVVLN